MRGSQHLLEEVVLLAHTPAGTTDPDPMPLHFEDVRTDDLMHAFDRVRRRDLFDSTVAETVLPQYA